MGHHEVGDGGRAGGERRVVGGPLDDLGGAAAMMRCDATGSAWSLVHTTYVVGIDFHAASVVAGAAPSSGMGRSRSMTSATVAASASA